MATEVTCPFCGAKKLVGQPCPKCGKRGGAILKVEDNSIWHPISEHRDFNDALKAAGDLFDGGMEEDFRIDDNPQPVSDWPGTLVPAYKLVKEECPECGEEVRSFDMIRTTDYHGISYRCVCMKCYERIMETKGTTARNTTSETKISTTITEEDMTWKNRRSLAYISSATSS